MPEFRVQLELFYGMTIPPVKIIFLETKRRALNTVYGFCIRKPARDVITERTLNDHLSSTSKKKKKIN